MNHIAARSGRGRGAPVPALTRRDYPKAVGLMVLGFSLVPGMDAIAKYLSADYSVFQVAWARFVFSVSTASRAAGWEETPPASPATDSD